MYKNMNKGISQWKLLLHYSILTHDLWLNITQKVYHHTDDKWFIQDLKLHMENEMLYLEYLHISWNRPELKDRDQ